MLCAKEDNFRDNHWHWGWWYDCPIYCQLQYIPRNMHTVFALLCFVVVIHWLIFPYPSGLLHWHCGNLTIAPVPAKQPWWIWINTSCEFIMNDCITTTKQSTTKPCAYFLGYTVNPNHNIWHHNEHRGIWNHHQQLECLVNHLFRLTSKKTSKPVLLALCKGNPPVTGGFFSQRASKCFHAMMSLCNVGKKSNKKYDGTTTK